MSVDSHGPSTRDLVFNAVAGASAGDDFPFAFVFMARVLFLEVEIS